MTTRHGVNSIEIDSKPYLLAVISGSHLVPEALSDEHALSAVPEWLVEMGEDWQLGYDMSELTAERWRSTTLCGREWLEMQAGDGPLIAPGFEPGYAPTCRSCLRIAGRHLVASPPDDRIQLIVSMAIDQFRESHSVRVDEVPGDQVEHLRKAIRVALRGQNRQARTYQVDATLFIVSSLTPDEAEMIERLQRAVSALNWDDPPSGEPDNRINWNTWGV